MSKLTIVLLVIIGCSLALHTQKFGPSTPGGTYMPNNTTTPNYRVTPNGTYNPTTSRTPTPTT